MAGSRDINLFGASLAGQAAWAALRGLDPRVLIANPVMLVIEVAAILTTLLFVWSSPGSRSIPGSLHRPGRRLVLAHGLPCQLR